MRYYDLNITGFHRRIKEYRLASGQLVDKFMKTIFSSDKHSDKINLSINSRLKLKKFKISDSVYTSEPQEKIEKMISQSLSDVLLKYKTQADQLKENIQTKRNEIHKRFTSVADERQ